MVEPFLETQGLCCESVPDSLVQRPYRRLEALLPLPEVLYGYAQGGFTVWVPATTIAYVC